jgi:D-amino peptidase
MVSGDEKVCEESRALLPTTLSAIVKWGMGRHAARCLPLEQARARIRDTASQAVAGADHMAPYVLDAPLRLEVEYPTTASAGRAAWLPTVERAGARRIACTLGDMLSLVGLLSVLVELTDKS